MPTSMGLSFEKHGDSGPSIVLLRGWTRCFEHWLGFEKLLSSKGMQVYVIDLPGVGKSSDFPTSWTDSIETFAQSVLSTIDTEGIKDPHLVGISLGGMVALGCALAHSPKIKSLVLINSSIGGHFGSRIKLTALSQILLAKVGKSPLDFQKTLAQKLLARTAPSERIEIVAEKWGVIDERNPVSTRVALIQLLAASRFAPVKKARTLRVPTLILSAEEDQFVPSSNSSFLLETIPGSILRSIPQAGHEATLDQPDHVAFEICTFIKGLA